MRLGSSWHGDGRHCSRLAASDLSQVNIIAVDGLGAREDLREIVENKFVNTVSLSNLLLRLYKRYKDNY